MKLHFLITIAAVLLIPFSAGQAAIVATESFDYPLDGYGAGLEGKNGGSGFSGPWKEFGSNANNGVFAGDVAV